MANASRVSPLSFDTPRHSPFRRQNSASPATVRATTPTQSPTKQSQPIATLQSPTKSSSLSPEKPSPFVRRPSQVSQAGTERPASPFTRPSSSISLGIPQVSPSRASCTGSKNGSDEDGSEILASRRIEDAGTEALRLPSRPSFSLARHETAPVLSPPNPIRHPRSPSPFDGAADIRANNPQGEVNIRPAAQRASSSSAASTIKAPTLTSTNTKSVTPTSISAPRSAAVTITLLSNKTMLQPAATYTSLPGPLLRSLRESFSVLDSSASGTVTPASLVPALTQLGLDASPATLETYFPASRPGPGNTGAQLTLAQYLDLLAAPLARLTHSNSSGGGGGSNGGWGSQDELLAAFEAYDLEDCGSVDVGELKAGVMAAFADLNLDGKEDMAGLSESDVEAVLGEFSGRRAFGKGRSKTGNLHGIGSGTGEVFRYREFMARVGGVGADEESAEVDARA